MKTLFLSVSIFAALLLLAVPVSALSYTISVGTDFQSYAGTTTIHLAGQVSPAPGPGTGVSIRIYNPNKVLVTADTATVNGTSGFYSDAIVTGGSSLWVSGNYVVNATWGAFGPAISSTAGFSWSAFATTTTTSSSTTSSSTSTTSSISSSTTSTTSTHSSSTSTTSSTSSTSSSTTSTSSTSGGGGGGIPEFPFQYVTIGAFTFLVIASYLYIARGRKQMPLLRK